jgi:hypothetical protein
MLRLRLVRTASAAQLQRLDPSAEIPRRPGLVEVAWALLPQGGSARDARSVGRLLRGVRRSDGDASLSYFDSRFFDPAGKPAPGALAEVGGGVLWFEVDFAAGTTVLRDGWRVGDGLDMAATSWDAWSRARPDATQTFLNEPAAGQGRAAELPNLPRRVRILLELEPADDRRERTRLAEAMESDAAVLLVEDERFLPEPGTWLLLDEEWLELVSKSGARVSVRRGQRSTKAVRHDAGTLLHHGFRVERELAVPAYRDSWESSAR